MMASSQSEQEGVEAMLGLGQISGAGPADEPGEEDDDGPMIPGVMIKGNQEDIVRRALSRTGAGLRPAATNGCLTLHPPHARCDKFWWLLALRGSARVLCSASARAPSGRRCRSRRHVDTIAVWAY